MVNHPFVLLDEPISDVNVLLFAASRTEERLDQRWWPSGRRSFQNRQIWKDKIPRYRAEGLDWNLRLGSKTLPQVHGFQGLQDLSVISNLNSSVSPTSSLSPKHKIYGHICNECLEPRVFFRFENLADDYFEICFQSFGELAHRPLLVDLTVEEGTRLKVIYGSTDGFHAVDLDSASVYDIYLPKHVSIVRSDVFHSYKSIEFFAKIPRYPFFRLKVQSVPTA